MKRELTCIICPRGCALTVKPEQNGIGVQGNFCPRGEAYAIAECTNPTRTVTATVRVANRADTMLAVKTQVPVAKGKMMDVMAFLRKQTVDAPVKLGTILFEDVCGSAIVATQNIL